MLLLNLKLGFQNLQLTVSKEFIPSDFELATRILDATCSSQWQLAIRILPYHIGQL